MWGRCDLSEYISPKRFENAGHALFHWVHGSAKRRICSGSNPQFNRNIEPRSVEYRPQQINGGRNAIGFSLERWSPFLEIVETFLSQVPDGGGDELDLRWKVVQLSTARNLGSNGNVCGRGAAISFLGQALDVCIEHPLPH